MSTPTSSHPPHRSTSSSRHRQATDSGADIQMEDGTTCEFNLDGTRDRSNVNKLLDLRGELATQYEVATADRRNGLAVAAVAAVRCRYHVALSQLLNSAHIRKMTTRTALRILSTTVIAHISRCSCLRNSNLIMSRRKTGWAVRACFSFSELSGQGEWAARYQSNLFQAAPAVMTSMTTASCCRAVGMYEL